MRLKRLTLADLERLQEIGDEIQISNWFSRLGLISEFIGHLVYARWPLLHIKKLPKLMESHDLLKKGKGGSSKGLTPLAAWLGARLGQTPQQIKDTVSSTEVHAIYVELLRKDIEKKMAMLMAHHDPKALQKAIKQDRQKLKHKPVKKKSIVDYRQKTLKFEATEKKKKKEVKDAVQPNNISTNTRHVRAKNPSSFTIN